MALDSTMLHRTSLRLPFRSRFRGERCSRSVTLFGAITYTSAMHNLNLFCSPTSDAV